MITTATETARPYRGPDLGLQAHFTAPPGPDGADHDPQAGGSSLVERPHNSEVEAPPRSPHTDCPAASWVVGTCKLHEQMRWILVPCKSRDCDVCGPNGRYKIAQRIAYGVRHLWPCAWIVLTFDHDIDKKAAVRKLAYFVKQLRQLRDPSPLHYAATYELTANDRLHINLIIGPWTWIDQPVLQAMWGARVWIEWVKDEQMIAKETAKAHNPESLGTYISKLEQAVPHDRRVSYSRGWPKEPPPPEHNANIIWRHPEHFEVQMFLYERLLGHWWEIEPGHWVSTNGDAVHSPCHCFHRPNDLAVPEPPGQPERPP